MAHTVASSWSVPGMDKLAIKAIQYRENVVENYLPILSAKLLPMLTFKQHGDCTIVDPRACFNHQASAADLSCIIFAPISKPYFDAMVAAGYILNKTRVVLHCTEYNSYVYVQARNPKKKDKDQPSVEELIDNLKSRQGKCRPGMELLTLDYEFEQPKSFYRKRRHDSNRDAEAPPATTTVVLSSKKFEKRMEGAKTAYDCVRRLQSEEDIKKMATNCLTTNGNGKRDDELGRPHVAILVISGPWMLRPDKTVY